MVCGARGTRCGRRIFIDRRDRPNRLVKINLRPLRASHLAGTDEGQGEQLQPAANFRHPVMAVDRAQQFPELYRLNEAARWRTIGDISAPFSAAVGSLTARPVATA